MRRLYLIYWLLLFSFAGCVSTRIEYTEPDKLQKQNVYRISIIFMKDGTVHDMLGIKSKLKLSYKDIGNVIIYKTADGETRIIKLADVARVKIEVMENDALGTSLIILGSIILVVLILIMILPFDGFNITG